MKNLNFITNTRKSLAALTALCGLTALLFYACKKSPTDGVKLTINSDIFKNFATLQIVDAGNPTVIPTNIQMTVTGGDADYIFEQSGAKDFTVGDGGIITVGVNPVRVPTASQPVSFYVQLSADGYLPVTQEVVINGNQAHQFVRVKMTNLNSPPAGLKAVQNVVGLTNGAVPATSVLKIGIGKKGTSVPKQPEAQGNRYTTNGPADTTYYDDGLTSIVLPTGTSFYYYVYGKTGTATGTRKVAKWDTTITYNDDTKKLATTVTTSGYYDQEYTYDTYGYVKTKYSGSSVTVNCWYGPQADVSYIFSPDYYKPYNIKLANGGSVLSNELLYKTAIKQSLYTYNFLGKVGNQTIYISPDSAAKWFTSSVVDTNFININKTPNRKIKAGDTLETGINYYSLVYGNSPITTTERTVVKLAKNGQLRVQTESRDAGLYFQAPYVTPYNYTMNYSVSADQVYDPENLRAYVQIKFNSGPYNNYLEFFEYANVGTYDINNSYDQPGLITGKIRSIYPITLYPGKFDDYYCIGNNVKSGTFSTNTTVNLFAGLSFPYVPQYYSPPAGTGGTTGGGTTSPPPAGTVASSNPRVTFNIALQCANKGNVLIKPTYQAYLLMPSGDPVLMDFKNGFWATSGFAQGKTYTVTGWVGKTKLQVTKTINDTTFKETISLGSSTICNNF